MNTPRNWQDAERQLTRRHRAVRPPRGPFSLIADEEVATTLRQRMKSNAARIECGRRVPIDAELRPYLHEVLACLRPWCASRLGQPPSQTPPGRRPSAAALAAQDRNWTTFRTIRCVTTCPVERSDQIGMSPGGSVHVMAAHGTQQSPWSLLCDPGPTRWIVLMKSVTTMTSWHRFVTEDAWSRIWTTG